MRTLIFLCLLATTAGAQTTGWKVERTKHHYAHTTDGGASARASAFLAEGEGEAQTSGTCSQVNRYAVAFDSSWFTFSFTGSTENTYNHRWLIESTIEGGGTARSDATVEAEAAADAVLAIRISGDHESELTRAFGVGNTAPSGYYIPSADLSDLETVVVSHSGDEYEEEWSETGRTPGSGPTCRIRVLDFAAVSVEASSLVGQASAELHGNLTGGVEFTGSCFTRDGVEVKDILEPDLQPPPPGGDTSTEPADGDAEGGDEDAPDDGAAPPDGDAEEDDGDSPDDGATPPDGPPADGMVPMPQELIDMME